MFTFLSLIVLFGLLKLSGSRIFIIPEGEFVSQSSRNTKTSILILLVQLTLDDVRVVLQEKVVQILGNEGRHAGIR